MENKFIIGDCRIVRLYEDSNDDSFWKVQLLNNSRTEFIIRFSHSGEMHISIFPSGIRFKDRAIMIRTFCEHICTQRTVKIRVPEKNVSLRTLCQAAGFKYLYHEYVGKIVLDVLYFPS